MTTPEDPVGHLPEPSPADELDELASARLDGLVGPDGPDAPGASPTDDPGVAAEVARRQARFERVRAVLAGEPAVDPEARERAIAAALDAFEVAGAGTDEVATRRAARERRRAGGLRVVGAAAAVLAAVALGAAILDGAGDRADVTATQDAGDGSAGDESADRAEEAPSVATADALDEAEGADGSGRTLVDLGAHPDTDALLDAVLVTDPVESSAGGSGTFPADDGASRSGCASALPAGDRPEALLATATVGGDEVEVWQTSGGDVVVVDLASCDVLDRRSP